MRALIAALAAALLLCLVVSPADTRGRFHHHSHHRRIVRRIERDFASFGGDPRPHAWCGWWLRHHLGVADRAYNRAAAWARWGHGTVPEPNAVVVWAHHVGLLVSHVAGSVWVVLSGNDGHAVRERPRSVAGAIAFRAGGSAGYADASWHRSDTTSW